MSTRWGLCEFGYDPDTSAVIGTQWARHTRSYGVDLARVAITTGKSGNMPTGLLRNALDAYNAAGIMADAVFTPAFLPVVAGSDMHSNMVLNTTGDTFTSPWIDGVTLRGTGVARQAMQSGLKTIIWGNEPNELAMVQPGVRVAAGPKGGALAPTVCASTYWQAASRLRSVGVADVYCGALSVLPQTGTNPQNGYYAAYVTAFYEACNRHGRHAPYPWSGWAVNAEGVWSTATLTRALAVLRGIMTKYGDTGHIRITECGWKNSHGVNAADATATFAAIDASEATSAMFFQGPGAVPYLGDPASYSDYGCYQWRQNGGTLIPQGDYSWGSVLRPLLAPLAPKSAPDAAK